MVVKTSGTSECWQLTCQAPLDAYSPFLASYLLMVVRIKARETRERWPELDVETEVIGDSKSTNERGLSLVDSLGLSCQYN
jgi:hypothetical protein